MIAKFGAAMLLAGAAVTLVVVAIAFGGGEVGVAERNLPPPAPGELASLMAVVLFGIGALALSIGDRTQLPGIAPRIGHGLLGVGFLSHALGSALPSYFGIYVESYPVLLLILGFALAAVGLVVTSVALVRSTGWLRIAGAAILAGLIVPVVVVLQPGAVTPPVEALVLLVPFGLALVGIRTFVAR